MNLRNTVLGLPPHWLPAGTVWNLRVLVYRCHSGSRLRRASHAH